MAKMFNRYPTYCYSNYRRGPVGEELTLGVRINEFDSHPSDLL